ncbi:DNA topoisomerase I [Georgenia satyanarayanai]|uniref:DNA topoisomerase 1 n=1 Tax=Georgenia satyanarayanai TaxID=860221 RepID=A0A2Y9A4E2_9MICO|nr:type I DNA topoisomerase [Georgenia satyanarayanai]PYG01122.1 DNA topoisomerase I [Georgenia satyanarayanai]SSA39361.1 DNA topoisomerase I [Georgenia satyanarayanai]
MTGSRKLVIVESPAKARTIGGYLGPEFDVEASVGHIRDLPQPSELPAEMKKGPFGKFAIDVEGDFEPYYVVDADKKKKVTELKRALKDADELYLATDEDREGEAIAWHLLDVLKPKVPVKRMVFHEITKEAIARALENTRELDERLVDAQEARRILDRLVGYEVSPLLWRKVRPRISAGRVQSVATRMVVERERERMAFRAASYWDVKGTFTGDDGGGTRPFEARLVALDGAKVATGRDFGDDGLLTAAARKNQVVHLEQATATALAEALEQAPARVASMETKPYTRRPAAPFTTSTLQQEASRKLRMSSRETMRTAQGLYENGFITYMRTDSSALSQQAIAAARAQATELYGADYVPAKPRFYAQKSKGAQEAHEAIRPAGDSFRTPAQVAGQLTGAQFRLYELIWKRTVASQMADASGSTATVRLRADAALPDGTRKAELSASGTVITFRGFLAAYEEGRDAERYAEAGAQDKETRLPQLSEGDPVGTESVRAEGHETTPPPRYTEASLVKVMEERGIGRPSTYAATISVITDRGYVERRGQALVPTWLAFSVVRLLEEYLPRLVDYDFTASMESDLDQIAAGQEDRVEWLARFYRGEGEREGLRTQVEGLVDIDARAVNSIDIGEGITLRVGRYGPYLETTEEEGKRASVPDDVAPDELTVDKARELLAASAEDGRELGTDPETGHTIIARTGRYGPYVTEVLPEPEEPAAAEGAKKPAKKKAAPKPRTASLFKTMQLETVNLEDALRLLSLPRVVGTDPESGEEITAQNGRYGAYLKKGTDSRTLPEGEDQIFEITLEEALELYKQPKRGRGATAKPPLRELGEDPVSGKPVVVKDGRFGPYVTDGTTNATLRKDDDVETVTPERAYDLLAEKRAKAPAKKTTTRKTPTRKPAAKKAPAKKKA